MHIKSILHSLQDDNKFLKSKKTLIIFWGNCPVRTVALKFKDCLRFQASDYLPVVIIYQ